MNRTVPVLAFGLLAGCGPALEPADLVIENVTLYDGTGVPPEVTSVAVDDGVFAGVGPDVADNFAATRTIDGNGLFMIPGLWDAHAHLRSSAGQGLDIDDFLEYGITSIRDPGGRLARMQQLERSLGQEPGSGIGYYPAYFMLNGESFAPHQRAVTTEAQVVDAIEELTAAGAVFIKVHRALDPALLPVVSREAHARGLPVVGHIPLGMHPLEACEAGIDGVEHAGSFVEAVVSLGEAAGPDAQVAAAEWLLSPDAEPIYECLARRQVTVAPTLVVYYSIAARRYGDGPVPEEVRALIGLLQSLVARLHERGVPLMTGTDAADFEGPLKLVPGLSLHDELEVLEKAGVSPAALIPMATLNVARSVAADDRSGSIAVGKDADFVLLTADPAESAASFRRIDGVYRAGLAVDVTR